MATRDSNLLSLFLACSFVNADWDTGYEAYKAKDYKTALKEFKALADEGGLLSQYALGFMYQDGEGVIQDYEQAAKWYTPAAEQGYSDAQLNLGSMYRKGEGEGVIQDYFTP